MTFLAFVTVTFHYLFLLPILTVVDWFLLGLSPALHLLHYAWHALYIPLSFVGRFETLYIYLGVAALVGIITGSILHLTSTALISALNLKTTGPIARRSRIIRRRPRRPLSRGKVPVRRIVPARYQPSQLQPRPRPALPSGTRRAIKMEGGMDRPLKKEEVDTDWLRPGRRSRRTEGLLSQTILEEEDDSDAVF
ncbi:MAG: hypothetical protein M1837_001700 [Sclerophora amabilis]|nr:MAG: hypothetical protein M1837_001700 [Sclerophora amabilis]